MIKKVLLLILFSSNVFSAEFLVMKKNHWMFALDKTGWTQEQLDESDRQYRIGDIVQVFPDGTLQNPYNTDYPFYVVRVSDLSYETALKYQEQWMSTDLEPKLLHRRRYRVRAADLPNAVKNQLRDYGYYNTTWTVVRSFMRNMETGIDE